MPRALLLGGPLAGVRQIDSTPAELVLEERVTEQPSTCTPGRGMTVARRSVIYTTYVRVESTEMPPGAVVYRHEDYWPQPEDEGAVRRVFG